MQNALQASAKESISKQVYTQTQGTLCKFQNRFTHRHRVPCVKQVYTQTQGTLCKTGLHTDTGYPVQIPVYIFYINFLNKNCKYYIFF